jgi:hypothetical protein
MIINTIGPKSPLYTPMVHRSSRTSTAIEALPGAVTLTIWLLRGILFHTDVSDKSYLGDFGCSAVMHGEFL